jgi:3-hydroxyisobutyrate dehydrogenase-like beta-hydroxyacid dehydrogenase
MLHMSGIAPATRPILSSTVGLLLSDNPLVDCERVIVSLYSSEVVEEVLRGFQEAVKPGQVVIDTTTGNPEDSVRWESRLREQSAFYLDAPISGSSEQTRRGEATVIVGGDRQRVRAMR